MPTMIVLGGVLGIANLLGLGWLIYGQHQVDRRVVGVAGACAYGFELQKARESIERDTKAILAELGNSPVSGFTLHARLASVEGDVLEVAAELRRLTQDRSWQNMIERPR